MILLLSAQSNNWKYSVVTHVIPDIVIEVVQFVNALILNGNLTLLMGYKNAPGHLPGSISFYDWPVLSVRVHIQALTLDQIRKETVLLDQLLISAFLRDLALLKNDDPIRMPDR